MQTRPTSDRTATDRESADQFSEEGLFYDPVIRIRKSSRRRSLRDRAAFDEGEPGRFEKVTSSQGNPARRLSHPRRGPSQIPEQE